MTGARHCAGPDIVDRRAARRKWCDRGWLINEVQRGSGHRGTSLQRGFNAMATVAEQPQTLTTKIGQ